MCVCIGLWLNSYKSRLTTGSTLQLNKHSNTQTESAHFDMGNMEDVAEDLVI